MASLNEGTTSVIKKYTKRKIKIKERSRLVVRFPFFIKFKRFSILAITKLITNAIIAPNTKTLHAFHNRDTIEINVSNLINPIIMIVIPNIYIHKFLFFISTSLPYSNTYAYTF